MTLPIPVESLLHGKAVEWERLELKELDMTEGRATGIPKIIRAMRANGSPPPEFDFDEDHTYFLCRLLAHPQATMPEGIIDDANTTSGLVEGLAEGLVEGLVRRPQAVGR